MPMPSESPLVWILGGVLALLLLLLFGFWTLTQPGMY
jgi:hypothetical protein